LQKPELENSGEKAKSFTDEVSEKNEQKYQYSHLDDAVQENTEQSTADKVSEQNQQTETNTESEPESPQEILMCDDDSMMLAGFGVMTVNGALPSIFKAPVSIPEEQQESLAAKIAPLIKKYYSGGEMPQWLKRWQEEISCGLAVGTALFGCWQQARAFKANKFKSEPVSESVATSSNDEVVPEFSYNHDKAA
jgi:hypothetical protein